MEGQTTFNSKARKRVMSGNCNLILSSVHRDVVILRAGGLRQGKSIGKSLVNPFFWERKPKNPESYFGSNEVFFPWDILESDT